MGLKSADVIFKRHIFVSAQNGILLFDRLPASGKRQKELLKYLTVRVLCV